MSWRRYDDGYEDHPKIVQMIAENGYESYYRLGKIHAYCARHRTEGDVPRAILRELGVNKKMLATMIRNQLLEETTDGRLKVHDWADYNPTDLTNAARQARYRDRHGNALRNGQSNADSNANRNTQSNGPRAGASGRGPVPSRKEPSSVVESVKRPATDDDAKNDNEEEPASVSAEVAALMPNLKEL